MFCFDSRISAKDRSGTPQPRGHVCGARSIADSLVPAWVCAWRQAAQVSLRTSAIFAVEKCTQPQRRKETQSFA
jgi:hypothetical protein